MALTPQWLDELRARITLSSVIMRTVKLRRAGREWKACCPFHNENTPSFTVNDEKGFYHCFGCGAHGDAIRWMTDQRGLSFIDAVQELASEAGLEVPRPDPREAKRAEQRATLHDVMAAAQEWFAANLRSADGARARDYLQRRGLDAHTIDRFGFGFAPDSRTALREALARFDEALLIAAGLRIATEERDPYDRFRARLMLPIHDSRGRVIAFGGRILDAERKDAPKYLNSPDTPLFDKGRTLYNLHRASPASRQSGRIVVVEGYMDVIALAAAGIEEAVAPMGTALTEQQIELLWRMADKPLLCFDGDAAGRRAAIRAAERALPLLRPGCSLQFVHLPAGLDPDDIVRRDGRAGMEQLLEQPATLLDLIWNHERDSTPHASPEDKAGLKARLMAHVEAIADRDIAALYRREWMDRFSAFAFPPRERWKPNERFNANGRIFDFEEERQRREARKRAELWTDRELYLHRRLGAALAEGLLRRPAALALHAETLLHVPSDLLDPRIAIMIDQSAGGTSLDTLSMAAAIYREGKKPPSPAEYDRFRFAFVHHLATDEDALASLRKGVDLYAGLPHYRKEFARINARFAAEMTDTGFAEQQRALKFLMEFEANFRRLVAAA